jgi:hypothetical protein
MKQHHYGPEYSMEKVTILNAMDVEFMECKVMDNSSHIKKTTKELRSLLL